MHFLHVFSVAAAFASVVAVQTAIIAFTSVPAVVEGGKTYNITWGGGDGTSPVTIILREGDPANLNTIDTITTDGQNGSYLWTVSKSLATASDYALQILQGLNGVNYSGQFAVVGGTGSLSIAGYTATASVSNATITAASITSSFASIGTGTAMSRNTTFSAQTLTSTSSGPHDGISAPTAASSTFAAAATTSAPGEGEAARLGGFVSIALVGVAVMFFAL